MGLSFGARASTTTHEPKAPGYELKAFAESPSTQTFQALARACRAGKIPAETISSVGNDLVTQPTSIKVQALTRLRAQCASGSAAMDLNGWLGVKLLQSHPQLVIKALLAERVNRIVMSELAEATGTSTDRPFKDCQAGCGPRLEKFYESKLNALMPLKVAGPQRKVRAQLVDAIEMALHKARETRSTSP